MDSATIDSVTMEQTGQNHRETTAQGEPEADIYGCSGPVIRRGFCTRVEK